MDPLIIAWVCLLAFFVVILFEMFIPSAGLLFFLAVILACASVVAGFVHSVWLGAGIIAILVLSMPLLFAFFSFVWPYTPLGKRLIIDPPDAESMLPGHENADSLQSLKGAKALVISPMLPTGTMRIDGKSYVGTCESGAAEPGQWVRVVRVQMNRLVVMPVEITDDPRATGGFDDQLEKAVDDAFDDFQWEPDPPK